MFMCACVALSHFQELALVARAELAHASGDSALAALLVDHMPRDHMHSATTTPPQTSASGHGQGAAHKGPVHQGSSGSGSSTGGGPLRLSSGAERQLEIALLEMWQVGAPSTTGHALSCCTSSTQVRLWLEMSDEGTG
jgi:hypothetical protein